MIAYLRGKPIFLSNSFILDVNGVGYEVFITQDLYYFLKSKNENIVSLFIFSYIKEDRFELYGFLTQAKLDFFKKLINISGLGPKSALLILNENIEDIKNAIQNADYKFFSKIPRIGKKMAQKIILELKNKLDDISLLVDTSSKKDELAYQALIQLGFSAKKVQNVLNYIYEKYPNQKDTDTIVKLALKNINKL